MSIVIIQFSYERAGEEKAFCRIYFFSSFSGKRLFYDIRQIDVNRMSGR